MPGIDESLTFYPLGIAVLTISDTRTLETDTSGGLLVERLQSAGHKLIARDIVKDEIEDIRACLREWLANPEIEIVLTTGGTGFSPRDHTPEAVKPLLKREMDGFSAAFHQKSMQSVGVATMQSRAFAGQAGAGFIFCVPGSTGACRDAWDEILAFQLDYRHRPCNFVEIMPRLDEHLRRK